MLSVETWIVFLSAALALAFVPGPGMLYVLSRTMEGGRRAGILSTLGAATGGAVHVIGAAIGTSALLATSQTAFLALKVLGGCFLLYLGLKMIFAKTSLAGPAPAQVAAKPSRPLTIFSQGVATEILNPKTAMFFFAFIPQFVQPSNGDVFTQLVVLGLLVVVLNTVPDLLIAYLSKPIGSLLQSWPRIWAAQRSVAGLFLVALGIYTLASGTNKAMHATSA